MVYHKNTSFSAIFFVGGGLSWKHWNLIEIWIFSNTKVCPKIFCKVAHSIAKQNHSI